MVIFFPLLFPLFIFFSMTDLEGLDEGPEQGANPLPPVEQLDQSHHSEQPKEGDGDARAFFCVLQGAESSVN